ILVFSYTTLFRSVSERDDFATNGSESRLSWRAVMSITIVDYGAGNLKSVQRACAAVGLEPSLAQTPEEVLRARRLIFPGVGNAQSAMQTLVDRGLDDALREVFKRGTP